VVDITGMAKNKWSIVVILDGETLKATGDGTEEGTVFEGREDDIAMAKALIRRKFVVPLGNLRYGPEVLACYDSAIGLTAALINAGPSEGILWRAPKEVTDFIENYEKKHNPERRFYGQKDK
jgi:hypothetical protein